jgi:hypothetical protein
MSERQPRPQVVVAVLREPASCEMRGVQRPPVSGFTVTREEK